MNETTDKQLIVPGAQIAYQMRGTGPILLLIAGGEGSGNGFTALASYLTHAYTVVTYDRRGAGRSAIDDPAQDVSVETHSDDAHYLLTALTSQPAFVFGSSAGAVIALDLVTRYPQQVRSLIAHEPPAPYLLPDSMQAQFKPLESMQGEGMLASFQQFTAQTGVTYANRPPATPMPQATQEEATKRAQSFFAYTFKAVGRYQLDLETLKASSAPIVVAGGNEGREFIGFQSALAVAKELGKNVVEFPGHHAGYVSQPHEFAEKLEELLQQ